MDLMSVLKIGLMAAIPVAVVTALVIFARASAIDEARESSPSALGFSGDSVASWALAWAGITLVFGVVAAWSYGYLSSSWGWGVANYLGLAVVLAAVLSALLFVKVYDGEMHALRVEYTLLNFVYALGFGALVPRLVG